MKLNFGVFVFNFAKNNFRKDLEKDKFHGMDFIT